MMTDGVLVTLEAILRVLLEIATALKVQNAPYPPAPPASVHFDCGVYPPRSSAPKRVQPESGSDPDAAFMISIAQSAESNVSPSARSTRPIFSGQRFVVFDWMLDDLTRLLGPHTDAFALHEWFFALDAELVAAQHVVPQRDGGAWLQARTLVEAQRRGLAVQPLPGTRTRPTRPAHDAGLADAWAKRLAEVEE